MAAWVLKARPARPPEASGPPGSPSPVWARQGALSWFVATVSLVLAANMMFSRYLFWDSYYDLYAGRYIVAHGIPRTNVVTLASHGAPWIDQQWLAHLLYYGAWSAGGYPALAALSATLVTAGFAVLALLMLRRGVPPVRMFAWVLAAFAACMGNTVIRAQSFGYLFFALTLWLLAEDDRAPRLRARTWLLIPVFVVWANTHGSVLLGVGLVGIYSGYRMVRGWISRGRGITAGYACLAIATAITVICTPYGPGVIRYYLSLVGNPALTHNIVEWAPPSLSNPYCWAFFALAAAMVAALAVGWRRGTRPDPLLSMLAAVLLALACTGIRYQAWFAFAGSLLAADTLARLGDGSGPALGTVFRRALTGLWASAALASVGVLAVTPVSQFQSEVPVHALSVAAKIAAQHRDARILGDDWSGTAMLWLYPSTMGRIGFDARLEQYSTRDIGAYFDFLNVRGPAWARVTRGYSLIVASRAQHPSLARALIGLPGWRVVYHDATGVVLERKASA